MTSFIRSLALLLALASVCLADGFSGDSEQPPIEPPVEPFVGEKADLFRFSRSAKSPSQIAKYEQQQQQQVENDQVNRQQAEQYNSQNEQQQQQVVVANELPAFSSGGVVKAGEVATTTSQVAEVDGDIGQQQHQQQQKTSSSSSSSGKKSALSKTITTTTTTTTTTKHNNQDQPQVAQIREIRVHTVPLSEAVHYANYMVVPTSSGARAAHLEESSSSSSSHKSSSSTSSETEQVAVAPAPTVVVDPPPAAVAPDCVLHRLVVERPVSSQLVVNVAPEVKVSHSSSSSSHSSKIVSQNVAAPETTVYTVRRTFVPPPVYSARVVQVAAPAPAMNEEHFRSEIQSSRQESHGLGHSVSSSSSSSSSRSSKSSTTTTSQTAALVAPPPPPPQVRTVTTFVRQAAPLVAVKAAPLVEVSSGRSNDVSVNVDHRQSGPNYNYGYSIKQHSSEPATKGVVVGDRVVYLK